MAKRRSKSRRQRGSLGNANRRLLPSSPPSRFLAEIADLRVPRLDGRSVLTFTGVSPTYSVSGTSQKPVSANTRARSLTPAPFFLSPNLQFDAPASVLVCVRRNRRREVLHARGVAGGRVSRVRRRNRFSGVKC